MPLDKDRHSPVIYEFDSESFDPETSYEEREDIADAFNTSIKKLEGFIELLYETPGEVERLNLTPEILEGWYRVIKGTFSYDQLNYEAINAIQLEPGPDGKWQCAPRDEQIITDYITKSIETKKSIGMCHNLDSWRFFIPRRTNVKVKDRPNVMAL